MTLILGDHVIGRGVVAAPMAGVTDLPFRRLCRRLGAELTVSEMVSADLRLKHSRKSRQRMDHRGEPGPRSVQLLGHDPAMLADAARYNVDHGAQIIDINMGCPAKKVCHVAAGSALLRDERRVGNILEAVVSAVAVPVTLKMRTGWSPDQRNGVVVAEIAEQAGIQMLAVHGRTRACAFRGQAEYETIAAIKQAVSIPVLVNGDIDSPKAAESALQKSGADGVMIGRAAIGRPWLFREIADYLQNKCLVASPAPEKICSWVMDHLQEMHNFYGKVMGVCIARKHIKGYLQSYTGAQKAIAAINRMESDSDQLRAVKEFFGRVMDDRMGRE